MKFRLHSNPLLVLLLILLGLTACSQNTSDDINISSICFAEEGNPQVIVHPFLTDSGIVAVLPSHWRATQIIMKQDTSGWLPITVEWGKASNLNIEGQLRDICFLQSHLNTIWITTQSGSMAQIDASKDKSVKESGYLSAIDTQGRSFYDGNLKQIKGRGNSSWLNDKKPYNIQVKEKTKLFDLKKSKKFCLIASSGITDLLSMKIAEEFGTSSAIASCPVTLYLNGNYNGLYLLTNKVDISKSAVDITDLEALNHNTQNGNPRETIQSEDDQYRYVEGIEQPEDISGGYLIEVLNFKDRYFSTKSGFIGGEDNRVDIKSPEKASKDEVLYIQRLFNDFYFANKANDGINPDTQKSYADYIDLPSFARYYLVEEVLANMDGGYGNLYFYKDRDSIDARLYAGPIWDMGWSMGQDDNYPYNSCPKSLFVRAGSSNPRHRIFNYLFQHEEFRQMVNTLYLSEMKPILDRYFFSSDDLFQSLPVNTMHDIGLNHLRWPKCQQPDADRILTFMQNRIGYMDEICSLSSEKDYCQVSVNAGFQHRNIMFLVKRGSVFELPTFEFWSPSPDAKPQSIAGWYDEDIRLDSNVQCINEDKFYLLYWAPIK